MSDDFTPEQIFTEIWEYSNTNDDEKGVHWHIDEERDERGEVPKNRPELPPELWPSVKAHDWTTFEYKGRQISVTDYGTFAIVSIDVGGAQPVKIIERWKESLSGTSLRPDECTWFETDELAIMKLRLAW